MGVATLRRSGWRTSAVGPRPRGWRIRRRPLISKPLGALRYRVEFTASERYVELLEEARNLLQHRVPDRDVARVHELAMTAFVEHLRKRRQAASGREAKRRVR